jgi:hypothetical protein
MKFLNKLPRDIIHEIILFSQEPYTDERKKIMSSIRREYKRKLLIKANVPHTHAWRILDIDVPINELLDVHPAIHIRSGNDKFHIPISIWIRIHRCIQRSEHFPIGHPLHNQADDFPVLDYSIWRWRRIMEFDQHGLLGQ